MLYVAYAITLPPRPVGSYLPHDIVRVKIIYAFTRAQAERPLRLRPQRIITRAPAIRRLVRAINALSSIEEGAHSCPGIFGQGITMYFKRRNGRFIQVVEDGCALVTVGHYRTLRDRYWGVWYTAHALVRRS